MSNFGVVQSSAATIIGLQSPEMVEITIEMLKNANEQREDTFSIGAMVTDDKNSATIEYGNQQARETRIKSEGQISGALASTITMGGSSVKGMYDQTKVDSMNKQLTNIGTFKSSLTSEGANGVGFKNPALSDLDGPPLDTLAKPEIVPDTPKVDLDFKNRFNAENTLDGKAKLFNDQPEEKYFENAAKEFSGDTDEAIAARKQAISDATELEGYLQRKSSELSTKIDRDVRSAQQFGQAFSGLVNGSFDMQAAGAQTAQAQQQVLQNMADNSKSFVETMQSTMDQMVQMSLKGIEELNQNLQSVVQASNSRA